MASWWLLCIRTLSTSIGESKYKETLSPTSSSIERQISVLEMAACTSIWDIKCQLSRRRNQELGNKLNKFMISLKNYGFGTFKQNIYMTAHILRRKASICI